MFGRLIARERVPKPDRIAASNGAWWRCDCTGPAPVCKGAATVRAGSLVRKTPSASTRSCGCLFVEGAAERIRLRTARRRAAAAGKDPPPRS